MLASSQSVAAGILQLALLSFVPVVLCWVLLNRIRVGEAAVRLGRRYGVVPPPKALPAGPPLEKIAADIRRIAFTMQNLPPRAPHIRRQGAMLAYDEALSAACRALGVDERLSAMPIGPKRDAERLRVECQLEFAGLIIDPPRAA